MMRCAGRWLMLIGALAAATGSVRTADAQPEGGAVRSDYAPPGVLARLGSDRLRHQLTVSALTYSPDGRWLASLGGDGELCIWDADSGQCVRRFKELVKPGVREPLAAQLAGASPTRCMLAFSADGARLAVGGVDNRLHIFDPAAGKLTRSLPMWGGGFAFASDGQDVGALVNHRKLVRRKISDGKESAAATLDRGNLTTPTPAAFSPDGKLLALVDERKLRLYDAVTGKVARELPVETKAGAVALLFAPNGKALVVGSAKQIRVWDVEAGMPHVDLPTAGNGTTRLAFSPDGSILAVSAPSPDGVVLWNLADGKPLRSIDPMGGMPTALGFSPDGKTLAIGSGLRIDRFEAATGKRLDKLPGHHSAVTATALSADGRLVASGDAHGTCYLWEAATGRPLHALDAGQGAVVALAFSPDAQSLATVSNLLPTTVPGVVIANPRPSSATLRLWNVRTGKETHRFLERPKSASGLAFSPDGQLLAAGGPTGGAVVWNVQTKKEVLRVGGHLKEAKAIQFLADGQGLLVGENGADHVYRLDTGEELTARTDPSSLAVFSPDGRFAIGRAAARGIFTLRDRATNSMVRLIGDGGRDKANFATSTISADGQLLAAASNDRQIALWETASGKELLRWRIEAATARLAFLPGGKAILAAGADGVPQIWDLAPAGRRPAAAAKHEDLWAGLLADDAPLAYGAGWALAAQGDAAVQFLRDRLQPAAPAKLTAGELDKLIAALDSNRFAEREQALNTLKAQGRVIAPFLQKALANWSSLEAKVRLERLLLDLEQETLPPSALRTVRAVRVLEQIGSAEAAAALQIVATGDPGATETMEAAAALQRLHQRRRSP